MASTLFIILIITITFQPSAASSRGFSFAIHRHPDSPFSPSYNPKASAIDRENTTYQRSISRYKYIISQIGNSISPDGIQIPVTPGGKHEYVMTVSMGTPPVKVTAIVDTGSGFSWIQCLPCDECFEQDAPVFDASKSTSYNRLKCDHPACNVDIPDSTCVESNCQYSIGYGDGSVSKGEVAVEDFTFTTTDRFNKSVPALVFGCGHFNRGIFEKKEQGIIGLDMSSASLIIQLGTDIDFRFSYCLVPFYQDGGSQMVLGDRAVLSGQWTPMVGANDESSYLVDLDDISVGKERLNITPGAFHRKGKEGGMFIDNGSILTELIDIAFKKLISKLKDTITLPEVEDPFYLCFEGTPKDLEDQPIITFHFRGGLDVPWAPMYSFFPVDANKVCLSVISAGYETISMLGTLAQQNMNMGFDIKNSKVFMSPRDCQSFGPPP